MPIIQSKISFHLTACIIVFTNIMFGILGCDSKEGNENISIIQQDSTYVDIPKNQKGDYSLMYKFCKSDEKLLGLDSLREGFDSIQIRIWFTPGMSKKSEIICLTNSTGNWAGKLISWFASPASENAPKDSIISKKVETVSPKSGWEKYIEELLRLNIMTLPDDSNVKGVESGGGDLRMTSVEIATKNMYRFYSYTEPSGYSKQFKELVDMENIIHYTKSEFPQISSIDQ